MDTTHSISNDIHLHDVAELPRADESRIHKPIRVQSVPHIVELLEELKVAQCESGPWEDFYVSMSDASYFPYANGRKSGPYVYTDDRKGKLSIESMNLSDIVRFRTADYLRIFWLIPVTDVTTNKSGFYLYSNSVWRDARICREFLVRLTAISASLIRSRNAIPSLATY